MCQSNSYLSLHNQESLASLTLFTAIEELIACSKFSLSEVQKLGRARIGRSPTSGAHQWAPAHVEVNDDSQPRRLGTRKSIVQSPSLVFEGGREGGREEERERGKEGGRRLQYEKIAGECFSSRIGF